MDIDKGNKSLLDIVYQYQHIKYKDITVSVPYFINTAEVIYKNVMTEMGIEKELISKVIKHIKEGNTPLGSGGGKGSPEEITKDLIRLIIYLNKINFYPKKVSQIRNWMKNMHIGLDCSGYVYNVLEAIQKDQGIDIIIKLAWDNQKDIKRSHAGASVFNSNNLRLIEDYQDIKPLDIIIPKDLNHIGIFTTYQNSLYLSECSMGFDGIILSKVECVNGIIKVGKGNYWNKLFKKSEVFIRRITS